MILSATCRVVVCPAMDLEMWKHRATARNVALIREYGYDVWGPADGELASGKKGVGRLLALDEIVLRLSMK